MSEQARSALYELATDVNQAEGLIVLNAFRSVVQALRQASSQSEKLYGLSAAQLYVMQVIAKQNQPLSVKQLAEITGTHQSSVSVVVKKLVDRQLLHSCPSPEDARVRQISLTSTGLEQLHDLPPLIQDHVVASVAKLSETDRQALVTGLKAFLEVSGLDDTPALFFEE